MTDVVPLTKTTFSGMTKFGDCPREWYLSEFLGLQPIQERRTGPLPFGSRIHLCLEIWGKSGWGDDIGAIWNKLVDRERGVYEDLGWNWGKDQTKENTMGHAMVTGYAEWLSDQGDTLNWRVVAVEAKKHMPLPIKMPDGRIIEIILASKLDLVEEHIPSGALYVDDYKTAQSLAEDAIYTEMEKMQGKLYVLQLQNEDPERRIDGVVFTFLRKVQRTANSNPPYFYREVRPLTKDSLRAARVNAVAQTLRIVDATDRLEAGVPHWDVVPFQVSWKCRSCPFRNPCELMRDGRMPAANAYLRDNFVAGDPLARYTENDPLQLIEGLV